MTASDIINLFRGIVNDEVEPYRWSNTWALTTLNEAENEACERALMLYEIARPIVQSVKAGVASYELDSSIISIDRVKLGYSFLSPITLKEADILIPGWDTGITGTPEFYFMDYNTMKITLVPVPSVTGTLTARYYRLPLVAMEQVTDEPEIAVRHQAMLHHWLVYRALTQADEDKLAPQTAAFHLGKFEQHFGYKSGARDEMALRLWTGIRPAGSYCV